MNWAAMSKEQRDRVVLKALVGALAAVGLFYYGVYPLIDRAMELHRRRERLNEKLREADAILRGEDALRRQTEERRQRLVERLSAETPPLSNPLLWATEVIYKHARATGVAVESVSEIKGDIPFWAQPPETKRRADDDDTRSDAPAAPRPPPRRFAPYSVQVNLISSYDRLKAFAHSLETENPAVTLAMISVVAREATPEQHQVRLVVEWPRLLNSMRSKLDAITVSE